MAVTPGPPQEHPSRNPVRLIKPVGRKADRFSALIMGLTVPRASPRKAPNLSKDTSRYFAELTEGLRFIREDTLLPRILVVFMFANIAASLGLVPVAY
ncbi:hypothetical protein ACFU6I_46895 [Streptomyces sp. NPDC057486]|uniref:hypothetical protein n=1 Tax=Streptomyces sp. NPDC057486 TaxID=3346145 RepID=UPI0036D1F1E3